jgi:sporulation protein YabP
MENNLNTSSTKSNLTLNNRNNLTITGVKKVRTTEPTSVVLNLENCSLIISGSNLTVQNINISSGVLELTGSVNSIRYTSGVGRKFSFKNMFK